MRQAIRSLTCKIVKCIKWHLHVLLRLRCRTIAVVFESRTASICSTGATRIADRNHVMFHVRHVSTGPGVSQELVIDRWRLPQTIMFYFPLFSSAARIGTPNSSPRDRCSAVKYSSPLIPTCVCKGLWLHLPQRPPAARIDSCTRRSSEATIPDCSTLCEYFASNEINPQTRRAENLFRTPY
jgi:hypothetical protein